MGKLFLNKAPAMKKIHQTYCAMHPKAIVIVDKYKEKLNAFMENQGAAKPVHFYAEHVFADNFLCFLSLFF